MCFFFSSRRRHTRCALVTGVQTCALPIWSCPALRAELKGDEPPARQATVPKHKAAAVLPQFSGPMQVLVGIGHPGSRYDNTPHNVGCAVLDALAARLGLAWAAPGDVTLAQHGFNGETPPPGTPHN